MSAQREGGRKKGKATPDLQTFGTSIIRHGQEEEEKRKRKRVQRLGHNNSLDTRAHNSR